VGIDEFKGERKISQTHFKKKRNNKQKERKRKMFLSFD